MRILFAISLFLLTLDALSKGEAKNFFKYDPPTVLEQQHTFNSPRGLTGVVIVSYEILLSGEIENIDIIYRSVDEQLSNKALSQLKSRKYSQIEFYGDYKSLRVVEQLIFVNPYLGITQNERMVQRDAVKRHVIREVENISKKKLGDEESNQKYKDLLIEGRGNYDSVRYMSIMASKRFLETDLDLSLQYSALADASFQTARKYFNVPEWLGIGDRVDQSILSCPKVNRGSARNDASDFELISSSC